MAKKPSRSGRPQPGGRVTLDRAAEAHAPLHRLERDQPLPPFDVHLTLHRLHRDRAAGTTRGIAVARLRWPA